MRSTLLIIGSAVLVAIAFCIYLFTQSAPAARDGTIQAVPTSAPVFAGAQSLHYGTDPWIKSFDGATEFRAVNYDPHPDGTIDLVAPQARFYQTSGGVMTIDGETGMIVDPNSVGGKVQGQSLQPTRGTMQHVILKQFKAVSDKVPQFTCWLNNISFDNQTFTIATGDCDIPDANGNLVHTPADQVPVHVVGIDYDFDGRGLYIKYDERDRKLQRLEIAHGEQLVIKHPSESQNPMASSPTPPATPQPQSSRIHVDGPFRIDGPLSDGGRPIELASADPAAGLSAAAGQVPTTSKKPGSRPVRKRRPATHPTTKPTTYPTSAPVIRRSRDASPYRATFYDNVHVTQVGVTLATADRMNADFFMGGSSSTKPSTTHSGLDEPPAATGDKDADANRQSASPHPRHPPATRLAGARPTGTGEIASTASSPATKPSEPAITVRWTGKLIVIPPPTDVPPLVPGDSAVEFVGDTVPAVLDRGGSIVHCASFQYHTLHQAVAIRNSPSIPEVTVVTNDGARILAPSVDYDGSTLTADIPGPAHAEFKVAADSNSPSTSPSTRPTSTALVDWADHCHLQLAPGELDKAVLKEAVLDGDVHVDHPQVKLISDELDLGFDQPPHLPATLKSSSTPSTSPATSPTTHPQSNPQLRRMDADGNVDCTLVDAQGRHQHILSDHLTMDTARDAGGQLTPSHMMADGDVQTYDDKQRLTAGHLVADLEPTTRPAKVTAANAAATTPQDHGGSDVKLKSLFARDSVHFETIAGDFADAEQLHMGETQDIDLFGQPTARVGDKDTIVTGPIIRYDPAGKHARVLGAGTLDSLSAGGAKSTTQTSASTKPATTRPVRIEWSNGLIVDGFSNRVRINGDVHTKSVSADGTINTADGDHIVMTLIDAPTTQPAIQPSTKPSAPQLSSSQPTTARSSDAMDGVLGGSQSNFMKDKLVSVMSLLGKPGENVEVKSRLLDPTGALLRSLDLLAPTVNYDKINDRFIVPTPGRMLVRDFRKDPATKPGAKPATPDDSAMPGGGGGMKGTTAFEWKRNLIFDQKLNQAVMSGSAHVVHEGGQGAAGYEMFADQIITDMDPAKPTTRAATEPTTKPAETDSLKVKKMTALGAVRMNSTRLQLEAAEAIYDPQTQIMTATGSARQPVELFDSQGLSTGSFDKVRYNMQTGIIEQLTNSNTSLRR